MICSMFPSAIAATGLDGNKSMNTWDSGGAGFAAKFTSVSRLKPAPGATIVAAISASEIAIAVVVRYSARVFAPTLPSLVMSSRAAVPNTSDTNTSGTTSNLRLARKIDPPTWKSPPTMKSETRPVTPTALRASPVRRPATIPTTILNVRPRPPPPSLSICSYRTSVDMPRIVGAR